MTQRDTEQYITRVGQALPRQLSSRQSLLDRARGMVEQFALENPEAEYGDIITAFGTPEALGAEMLSTLPPQQVETAAHRRRFHRRTVIAGAFLVLSLLTLFLFVRIKQMEEVVNGDFYVVISSARPMTDEEMEEFMRQTSPDAQFHEK